MKKIYLVVLSVVLASATQAQTVLRYQTHGLIADQKNEMKITDYSEPGTNGKNVVWDFRKLKLNNDFIGTLDDPSNSKGCTQFSQSNTVLEEFGNNFFFKTTEQGIEQHGFMSGNGSTVIIYDVPFIKMRYPFSFGSAYVGSFNGRYISNSKQLGTLTGSYAVEGDGLGTLMLPGNMVYENVLRVKEVKSYTQTTNGRPYEIETVTYRWYVNEHRFPILVLITSTTSYENGRTYPSTQAAYNPIALNTTANPLEVTTEKGNVNLETFPNPYHDLINIRFNLDNESDINLSVFDVTGRLVTVLYKGKENAGEKLYKFSAKENQLGAGAYIVRLNVNGSITSKRILELE